MEKSCQIEFSDTISELFGTKTTYPLAEKKGYDFVGWFDQNGEPISEEWTYTSSQTFHAEWVLHDNLITYNLFDGTNDIDNPQKYNIESADIILKTPTKEGYEFDGWYTDSELHNRIETITATDSQGYVLYAKWSKKEI